MMEEALSRRARDLEDAEEEVTVEPVAEAVLLGLREALLGGETHYTDRPGIRALRERIAERLSRVPDTVIVTAGENEALYVIGLSGTTVPVARIGDGIFREAPLSGVDPSSIIVGTLDALPSLRSFRLAFIAAPAELAPKMRTWKQSLSICTAAPSQRAALLAWKTP